MEAGPVAHLISKSPDMGDLPISPVVILYILGLPFLKQGFFSAASNT